MVHGGGHHDSGGGHHHGSGHHGGGYRGGGHHYRSGWGGQRHHHLHSNNNVFVVNQNPWNSGWSSFWAPPVYRRQRIVVRDRHSGDDCDKCCEACCLSLCTCSTCCLLTESTRVAASQDRSQTQTTAVRERTGPKFLCPGFCFSLFLLFILLAGSHMDTTWTLNAGESRQILKPFLISDIVVSSQNPEDVQVYALSGNPCPPLTGPTVTLEDDRPISLSMNDFQYDYFFLNPGSKISLDVSQKKGSTNLYLLRGESVLHQLDMNWIDDVDFAGRALVKLFASQGGYADVNLKYKARNADTYILVYDNASSSRGELIVHYKVDLTTYDLRGITPVCTGLDDPCSFHVKNEKSCMFVQVSGHPGPLSASDIVTIDLTGKRKWRLIVVLSSAPLLLFLLYAASGSFQKRDNSSYQPVGNEEERPPPTAPHPLPHAAPVQAQPAPEDYGAIPIVPAENVTPIPPPQKVSR